MFRYLVSFGCYKFAEINELMEYLIEVLDGRDDKLTAAGRLAYF
jgi:hypothetical protein